MLMLITVEKLQCIAFIFDRILGHDTSGWDLHKYCHSLFCQMPFYYCTYMLLPNSAPTSNCILSQNYKSCRLNTVRKYKTKLDSYLGWTNHHYFHLIRHGVSRGCSEYVIVSFSSPITTLVSLLLVFPPVFREISADDRRRVSKFLVYLLWHASDCGAKFLLRFIFVFPLVLAWTHL